MFVGITAFASFSPLRHQILAASVSHTENAAIHTYSRKSMDPAILETPLLQHTVPSKHSVASPTPRVHSPDSRLMSSLP